MGITAVQPPSGDAARGAAGKAHLFRVGQDGLELAEEALCTNVLVEVADPDREFLGLELLDSLDKNLCGIVSDCICTCDFASTHRLASWSAGRAHS